MSAVAQINKLKEERAKLYDEMRELTLVAESESRDLTAEEAQEFDRKEKDAESSRSARPPREARRRSARPSRNAGSRRPQRRRDWSEMTDEEKRALEQRSSPRRQPRRVPREGLRRRGAAPQTLKEFNELRSRATASRRTRPSTAGRSTGG
jgi:hypothetical protein